ncbi:transglutaminase-like cysteine peptidase [Pseudomonas stutzeri]|nr:transglutaminase-like cysteine peptidase [Stutzerimonas stutzeri]
MRKSTLLGSLLQSRRSHVLAGLLFGSGLLLGPAKAAAQIGQTHRHEAATPQLQAWRDMLARARPLSEEEQLELVNRFFNSEVRFAEDHQLWGQFDYWATPLELLQLGAGDCEDFALAKYFTLRVLGVPEQRLRIAYTTQASTGQAHMVLGYWPDNGELPLLLDNLRAEILPLTRRRDLELQFAFDAEHLYRFADNRLTAAGDARLLPHWEALQTRVSRELRHILGDGQMLAAAPPSRPAS